MTQIFTLTCDRPYTQCYYELYLEDGSKQIWENYEELKDYWMTTNGDGLSLVVPIPRKPQNKAKGF